MRVLRARTLSGVPCALPISMAFEINLDVCQTSYISLVHSLFVGVCWQFQILKLETILAFRVSV